MVDAAFGKTVRIEVVESTIERISVVALLVRIAEVNCLNRVIRLAGIGIFRFDVELLGESSMIIVFGLSL